MLSPRDQWHALRRKNYRRSTILHNLHLSVEVAKVVLRYGKELPHPPEKEIDQQELPEKDLKLLDIRNIYGETPFYRAALCEWDGIKHIWKTKKQNKLAEQLANFLVTKDDSWLNSSDHKGRPTIISPAIHRSNVSKFEKEIDPNKNKQYTNQTTGTFSGYTPLLLAAASGIVEIVERYIDLYPEAINHRVEMILSKNLVTQCNDDNLTAQDLFLKEHESMLIEARNWIKDTAQSCSTVAVLVATVVYAAAYSTPGVIKDVWKELILRKTLNVIPNSFKRKLKMAGASKGKI
ncbi:hypothetical protein L6164_002886 [Bauhinia variegata]|uniref:Uncharacterized protein n=1 Tax=Bauhinia variegata TaxID=167791 RepID=A0ACB9PZR4_BAUVA|nr:hypothetical protein L6164_002886 [Bauhinia variegata]